MVAPGSTDAVDVLVDVLRRVEEDDDFNVLQVQASGGQICSDEETTLARIELVELGVALGLRQIR